MFAACGTGEFHALSVAEVGTVVAAAVIGRGRRRRCSAAPAGRSGTPSRCARAAADAGADGLLVLPPYLVSAPADGTRPLRRGDRRGSELPVIVYHRANARSSPATVRRLAANPKVIGFKDGVGDIGTDAADRAGRPATPAATTSCSSTGC